MEQVHLAFGGDPVLEGVDLRIEAGERVGLIGRNGTGKSTIFRIVTGEIQPDKGLVDRMKRARFATLAQMHRVDESMTITEIVRQRFKDLMAMEVELEELEHKLAETHDEAVFARYAEVQEQFQSQGGYEYHTRVKQVLHGLGFRESDYSLTFTALSGGQRTRIMLALALLEDADLLLLDEPENHLDLEAREWLEDYLSNAPSAVMVVSHDRQLLNKTVNVVCELERGQVRRYSGNYDWYHGQKALLSEQYEAEYERQQEFIRKEEAWINRFRYKASKAKAVQSRVKRLEKLEKIEAPKKDQATVKMAQHEVARTGEMVLEARDLSMGYDTLPLYHNISFRVHRGERVGIIGPNGSGKTTLLRQIAGQHPGTGGDVTLGHKVNMGYYDQHHRDMNPNADILSVVQEVKPEWPPEKIRSYMGRFLFTGDEVFKTIGVLSGGELSRVTMARLLLSGANLLMLDEPTNHLDIPTQEVLEEALVAFPGTLVVVSHDRALLDRLVTTLIILEKGEAEFFNGNYTEYHEQFIAKNRPEELTTEDVLKIRRDTPAEKGKTKPQPEKGGQKDERKRKQRIESIEADIESMEALVEDLEGAFGQVDPNDYARAQALKLEYEGLKRDLAGLYAEWEELHAQR